MPYFAGPAADERDALLTFLAVPRAALRAVGRRAGQLLDAYEAG